MKIFLYLFLLLFFTLHIFAEDTTDNIKDSIYTKTVTVTAEKLPIIVQKSGRTVYTVSMQELKLNSGTTIQDKIQQLPGVDLRPRGTNGAQADLSLRGSNFDQVLVMFNGIKMNDIQTGHHNLDLPVDLDAVSSIELLQGGASGTLGPNAFAGAVNILTPDDNHNYIKINAGGGKYNYYNYGATLSQQLSDISSSLNGFNLFASFSKKKSDSYVPNTDFDYNNLYSMLRYTADFGIFSLQGGITNKAFGANSFYSAEYPNQFETTKTLFSALSFNNFNDNHIKLDLYWRRHYDKFELFRNNPASWYTGPNFNRTDVFGGETDYSFNTIIGTSSLGLEFRHEKLLSTNLGEIMSSPVDIPDENTFKYTKDGKRDNINIYIEQYKELGRFSLSAGLLANYYSDYNWNIYPGIDINFKLNDFSSVYGNIHKSLRVPTYTDLYYSDPSSIGDPKLKPEKSLCYEIGYRLNTDKIGVSSSVFRREGKNLIDWAYNFDDKIWHSMNVTEANTSGFEIALDFYFNHIISNNFLLSKFKISYTYVDVDKEKSNYISEYVMDFMKHKLTADFLFNPMQQLNIDVKMNYNTRNGSYLNYTDQKTEKYGSYFTLDARINYTICNTEFYIDASNITDTKYFAVSNVTMPGFIIKAGLSLNLRPFSKE